MKAIGGYFGLALAVIGGALGGSLSYVLLFGAFKSDAGLIDRVLAYSWCIFIAAAIIALSSIFVLLTRDDERW